LDYYVENGERDYYLQHLNSDLEQLLDDGGVIILQNVPTEGFGI